MTYSTIIDKIAIAIVETNILINAKHFPEGLQGRAIHTTKTLALECPNRNIETAASVLFIV